MAEALRKIIGQGWIVALILNEMDDTPPEISEFEQAKSEKGLVAEFWEFLNQNKKFWMIPIILVLIALGGLLITGGSSFAPFIYALF
jgi:hypothetical protein